MFPASASYITLAMLFLLLFTGRMGTLPSSFAYHIDQCIPDRLEPPIKPMVSGELMHEGNINEVGRFSPLSSDRRIGFVKVQDQLFRVCVPMAKLFRQDTNGVRVEVDHLQLRRGTSVEVRYIVYEYEQARTNIATMIILGATRVIQAEMRPDPVLTGTCPAEFRSLGGSCVQVFTFHLAAGQPRMSSENEAILATMINAVPNRQPEKVEIVGDTNSAEMMKEKLIRFGLQPDLIEVKGEAARPRPGTRTRLVEMKMMVPPLP
jgi:hypothetical protein